jgi:ABC-type phosphate transport system substrate-binding protein
MYAHGAAADTPRTPQANQIQIPFLGIGVVPIYRCDTCGGNLVLNKVTLNAIFTGVIQWWDDAVIQSLNPALTLPHDNIKVIVHSGRGASTATFARFLFGEGTIKSISSAYSWGAQPFLTKDGDTKAQMAVVFHDNSISYTALTREPLMGVSLAKVLPSISGVITPVEYNADTIENCFNQHVDAKTAEGKLEAEVESFIAESTNPQCWPIRYLVKIEMGLSYTGYDCNYGDPTTKFIAWLYSDITHEALMEHKMAPLPTEGRAAALEVLQAITCDEEFILPHRKFAYFSLWY